MGWTECQGRWCAEKLTMGVGNGKLRGGLKCQNGVMGIWEPAIKAGAGPGGYEGSAMVDAES